MGALAASVAHDVYNIVAVGIEDSDIFVAVTDVEANRGGLAVVADGCMVASLPLPLAGLLSDMTLEKVVRSLGGLDANIADLGCRVDSPFSLLSFVALTVAPELKLTDKGLVDALSGGRLMLGVGCGYQPPEFKGFGVTQENSRLMIMESFELLRRGLSGEKFTYDWAFWQGQEPTEVFPKAIQKPHPPFYMAAISPASYELAAKFGISLLRSPQFTDLGTAADAFDGYRKMMADQGFDADAIDQPFSVRTFVAPADEEAKAETKHVVWFYHLLATLLPGAPGRSGPKSGYENYPRDLSALSKITTKDVWERAPPSGLRSG